MNRAAGGLAGGLLVLLILIGPKMCDFVKNFMVYQEKTFTIELVLAQ
jgi:hypothetical protein